MTSPPVVADYPAAVSVLGQNILTLRLMLANCTAVQTLFDSADAEEAAERIYIGLLPAPENGDAYTTEELGEYRPFILLSTTPGQALQSNHETSMGRWSHGRRGQFDIVVERSHPGGDVEDDQAEFEWLDMVDSIRQSLDPESPGLIELHETAGMLSIRTAEVLEIYRGDASEVQQLGDYQTAHMRIHWGRL